MQLPEGPGSGRHMTGTSRGSRSDPTGVRNLRAGAGDAGDVRPVEARIPAAHRLAQYPLRNPRTGPVEIALQVGAIIRIPVQEAVPRRGLHGILLAFEATTGQDPDPPRSQDPDDASSYAPLIKSEDSGPEMRPVT